MVVSFFTLETDLDRYDYLTFYLARYNIEGEFLGFNELKTQLSLCPMTYTDVVRMTKFGVLTKNECEFELIDLISEDQDQL